MIRSRRWVQALLLAAVCVALAPAAASAHPLGNFSINHYAAVTVSPTEVTVDLVVDTAEIPTVAAIAGLDADGDGTAEPRELNSARMGACEARSSAVAIVFDGQPVTLAVQRASLELVPGAEGLPTLRTECLFGGPIEMPQAAPASLTVIDEGDPDRLGWHEIVVRGDGVTVTGEDAALDVSRRLTAYPDDLLQRPLDERSATVELRAGGARAAVAPPTPSDDGDASATIVPATPIAVVFGLLLAAVAGAGHAISPGHGKTLMAAYLVGSRGRRRDAVILGLAVTLSHTVGVLALAGLVLLAGAAFPADRIYPVLSAVAGVAVVVIGASMLAGCVRRVAAHRRHSAAHAHGHSHEHSHDHQDEVPASGRLGVVAIGLAGGLVPSPAALLLLLGAVAAGAPGYGLGLAVAFGLGMAGVLAGLGVVVIGGRDIVSGLVHRLPAAERLAPLVPWAASAIVLAGGVVLTGQAVIGRL